MCRTTGPRGALTPAEAWTGTAPRGGTRCDEDERERPSHLPMSETSPVREGDTGGPG